MNPTQLERMFHTLTGFGVSDLYQRARRLRGNRMLPVGGRGSSAPKVETAHVANMLMSLGAENSVDAGGAVLQYATLVPVDGTRDLFGNETFGESLEQILEDVEWRFGIKEIKLCRSWPEAVIIREHDGAVSRHEYRRADAPESGYGFGARVDITFSAGLIHQLVAEIDGINDNRGGWGPAEGGETVEIAVETEAAEPQ